MESKTTGMVTRSGRRLSVDKLDDEDHSTTSTPTKKRGRRLSAKPDLEDLPEVVTEPMKVDVPLKVNDQVVDSPSKNLRKRNSSLGSPAESKIKESVTPRKAVRKIESTLMANIVDSPKLRKNKRLSGGLDAEISQDLSLRRSRRLSGELNVVLENPIKEEQESNKAVVVRKGNNKRLSIMPTHSPLPEVHEDAKETEESSPSKADEKFITSSKNNGADCPAPEVEVRVLLSSLKSPENGNTSPLLTRDQDQRLKESDFSNSNTQTPLKHESKSKKQSPKNVPFVKTYFNRNSTGSVSQVNEEKKNVKEENINKNGCTKMDVDDSFEETKVSMADKPAEVEAKLIEDEAMSQQQLSESFTSPSGRKSSRFCTTNLSPKVICAKLSHDKSDSIEEDMNTSNSKKLMPPSTGRSPALESPKLSRNSPLNKSLKGIDSVKIVPTPESMSPKTRLSNLLSDSPVIKNDSDFGKMSPSVSPKTHSSKLLSENTASANVSFEKTTWTVTGRSPNAQFTNLLSPTSKEIQIGDAMKTMSPVMNKSPIACHAEISNQNEPNETLHDASMKSTVDDSILNNSSATNKNVSSTSIILSIDSPAKLEFVDKIIIEKNRCVSEVIDKKDFRNLSKHVGEMIIKSYDEDKLSVETSSKESVVEEYMIVGNDVVSEIDANKSVLIENNTSASKHESSFKIVAHESPKQQAEKKISGNIVMLEDDDNELFNESSKNESKLNTSMQPNNESLNDSHEDGECEIVESNSLDSGSLKKMNKSLNESRKSLNSKSLTPSKELLQIKKVKQSANNSSQSNNMSLNDSHEDGEREMVESDSLDSGNLKEMNKSLNESRKSLNSKSLTPSKEMLQIKKVKQSANNSSQSNNMSLNDSHEDGELEMVESDSLDSGNVKEMNKSLNESRKSLNSMSMTPSKEISQIKKRISKGNSSFDLGNNIEKHDKNLQSNVESKIDDENAIKSSGDYMRLQLVDESASEAESDYKSGDSMGESEREEMKMNEIIEHGESLDSESNEEESDVSTYEKDSFICSSEDEQIDSLSLDDGSSLEDAESSKSIETIEIPSGVADKKISMAVNSGKKMEGDWNVTPFKPLSVAGNNKENNLRKRKLGEVNKTVTKWTNTAGDFNVVDKGNTERPTRPISASDFGSTTVFNIITLKKHSRHVAVDSKTLGINNFKENMLYGKNIRRKDSKSVQNMQQKIKASMLHKNNY